LKFLIALCEMQPHCSQPKVKALSKLTGPLGIWIL
jgi:hypothetical protein